MPRGVHFGRWAKNATSDLRRIDIREFAREGLIEPGAVFTCSWGDGYSVRVSVHESSVSITQEAEALQVWLTWTPCHLGGRRVWFCCPGAGCGRRVAMLYGGWVFACRNCHQLNYPCQRENYSDRALRRAEKIRARLDWPPGIANSHGPKPKGMHWRTFERLVTEHDQHANRSMYAMAARLGLLNALT